MRCERISSFHDKRSEPLEDDALRMKDVALALQLSSLRMLRMILSVNSALEMGA